MNIPVRQRSMNKVKSVYINREISWLSFNERVLQEAKDPTVPLIERLKFLGIFSNNRDEFFKVRMGNLRRMEKMNKKAKEMLHEDPDILLEKIQQIVIAQQSKFEKIYQELMLELQQHDIQIINEKQLDNEQGEFVKAYFTDNVLPTLAPIMLDAAPTFPYLKDKSIYLIVRIFKYDTTIKPKHALLEIPDTISRFLVLPDVTRKKQYIILLDDVIRYCLDDLFSIFEYDSIEAYTIKMTRDAELDIDKDYSKSVVEKISKGLKKRKKGVPVRLTFDNEIPKETLNYLRKKIKVLSNENLIPGGRYHNFKDFINFPMVGAPELRYTIPHPLNHPDFDGQKSVFKAIAQKDILITYPYQSYHHVIDWLREASIDPKVESIRITLYRVAKNSNIINTLINALKNGKAVTAVVELQARFDEENNIYWADKLQEEGAKVIYGVPGLKVHSKLILISRKESGKTTNYAHIGTGNFNEVTAKIYSDFSLLTAHKAITDDIVKLFEFYNDNLKAGTYKHLFVAPFNMRKRFVKLINTEIENAKKSKEAYIILKLNNLVDDEMIDKLYEASAAGVKIKMIIRGICSLVTELPGRSDNVQVISIVDRFLEHSRVLIVCNNGDEKCYISSADWMTRNLDHRSEVAVPILDKRIHQSIRDVINIQLQDNTKARIINQKQTNKYVVSDEKIKFRSQDETYNYFLKQLKTL